MGTMYRNKGGQHAQADGTIIATGATFTDPDPDLCKKFGNKFEKIKDAEVVDEKKKGDDGPVDVTSDFPIAKQNDLTVSKEKGGWVVFDAGEAITEKPLKKKEVEAFIEDYVSEED